MTDIAGEVLDAADLADLEATDQPFSLALPDNVDERRLLDDLYADLHRGEMAAAVLAEAEMRKVIEFQQGIEHRTIEGMGQLVARVPLEVFLYWSAREGPEFWAQEASIDYFAKRNPGFRPVTKAKPGIVVPAKPAAMSGERGTKRPVTGKRGRWAA